MEQLEILLTVKSLECRIAEHMVKANALRIQAEGMIAENEVRKHRAELPAYPEAAFTQLGVQLEKISTSIHEISLRFDSLGVTPLPPISSGLTQ